MGILNITPDSFSDGGRFADPADAVRAGVDMVAEGAALLDIGAASTRPGAASVAPDEEWSRLDDVLRGLRESVDVPLSLDTTCASVLERALEVGVDLLNDVSALDDDPALLTVAAEANLPIVLMHRRGNPRNMQDAPHYDDAPGEVLAELMGAVERAVQAGVPRESLLLDPGIGFGKRLEDNLALLAALDRFTDIGHRTVLGCSRKAMLGALTGRPVDQREHGTTATTVLAAMAGVDFVRVHDCAAAADSLAVVAAVSVASESGRR
jgi:dihydropteroate synthase